MRLRHGNKSQSKHTTPVSDSNRGESNGAAKDRDKYQMLSEIVSQAFIVVCLK